MNKFDTELPTQPNLEKRFLAGFIDYLIISVFFFTYVFVFGEPSDEGGYEVTGWPALVPILFWAIVTVGIEVGTGATLGNSIAGLKAIPKNGTIRNLTFGESLKRHLLDPIDLFFFGLIAVVTINNTDKNQRLGDIWANTIVVGKELLSQSIDHH